LADQGPWDSDGVRGNIKLEIQLVVEDFNEVWPAVMKHQIQVTALNFSAVIQGNPIGVEDDLIKPTFIKKQNFWNTTIEQFVV
jgi:hypothetical protein